MRIFCLAISNSIDHKSFLKISFLSLVITISGCKSLYHKSNYSKESALGAISGNDWRFGYGYTDPEAKRPDGIEYMIVLTTKKPKNGCPTPEDKVADRREVIIGIDGKVGEMKIGARDSSYETSEDSFTYQKPTRAGSVAFFDPAKQPKKQFSFATSGKIKVLKITNNSIEGLVVAKNSPEQFVNGRFKAKICKWGQLN
jgi:hypothetical protein